MTLFVPYSNSSSRSEMAIAVDRMGRMQLNSALRRELDCVNSAIDLVVAYDKVNKRIGIAKPSVVRLTNYKPFRFDKSRGYANAKRFLNANQIPFDQAYRYVFDGKDTDGYLAFKLTEYDAPDQPDEVKAEMVKQQG